MRTQADRWLGDQGGKTDLKNYILHNLLVNLQIEQRAGQKETGGAYGAGNARQSRSKFEKTSELVMMLVHELEGDEEKKKK